jgi:hypothetical protein
MIRTKFFTRTALGLALAVGVTAGSATPVLAKAKPAADQKANEVKLAPSKAFIPVYVAAKAMLEAAGKRPDVIAARQAATTAQAVLKNAQGRQAQTDARARYDAAAAAVGSLLTAEKAAVERTANVITSADSTPGHSVPARQRQDQRS